MKAKVTEIRCSDCRHEDSSNLPFNACLPCVNMSQFSPKEELASQSSHECTGECDGNCNCGDFNE